MVTKMETYTFILIFACLAITFSSAIPKPEHHGKHKPLDRDDDDEDTPPLSSVDRQQDKKLADSPHYRDDEEDDEHHDPNFDHEAFLGKEEAEHFDQLSPEESKEGLANIYDRIDNNKDGFVTELELKNWIKFVQNQYIAKDTERQWKELPVDQDNKLTWEAFQERTYGSIKEGQKDEDGNSFDQMKKRDKNRWAKADTDKDGKCSLEEFAHFLHPEDAPHMSDIVVDETMEDIDKDKDGKISLAEYIEDMWPSDSNEPEPDWVKTEKEQFATTRDKNKDGFLDRAEVKAWIIPEDYDHSDAEAKHLVRESDEDKDGKLTKDEVLAKFDIFVGSQATDFGDALTHDEF